jgi:hypothetical protein
MSRDLDTTTDNAAQASHVVPYTLVELDYESGAVRIASTPFDITYDGDTYLGVGRLGSISAIQEGIEQKSYGVSMELSGIPTSYFAEMVQERCQDRACRIWYGFLDATSHRPTGTPNLGFGGRMDVLAIQLGNTITATLTAESRLVDWERAINRRFTDQDQQRAFPGDLGLQFVQATTDMELPWGRG